MHGANMKNEHSVCTCLLFIQFVLLGCHHVKKLQVNFILQSVMQAHEGE